MSHDFREQARHKHAENKMLILFEGRFILTWVGIREWAFARYEFTENIIECCDLCIIYRSRKLLNDGLNAGNRLQGSPLLFSCPSLLLSLLFCSSTRRNIFIIDREALLVSKTIVRGVEQIIVIFLLILAFNLIRKNLVEELHLSRYRSMLSNAVLGSARVHTVRIRGEQNGTVLSISPSPARRPVRQHPRTHTCTCPRVNTR